MLIMNPPYERLKTDKSDFRQIHKDENLYHSNRSSVENIVRLIKKSDAFPLSSEGILDLYKLLIITFYESLSTLEELNRVSRFQGDNSFLPGMRG